MLYKLDITRYCDEECDLVYYALSVISIARVLHWYAIFPVHDSETLTEYIETLTVGQSVKLSGAISTDEGVLHVLNDDQYENAKRDHQSTIENEIREIKYRVSDLMTRNEAFETDNSLDDALRALLVRL